LWLSWWTSPGTSAPAAGAAPVRCPDARRESQHGPLDTSCQATGPPGIQPDPAFNAGWHAHALTRLGEFLVSDPEHAKPERARAYLIDDDTVAAHAREHGIGQLATGTDPQQPTSVPPERPQIREHRPSPAAGRGNPEAALWAALVAAGPRGASIANLMQATGKGRTWVYVRLRQLADAGRVIQIIRGHWRAARPSR